MYKAAIAKILNPKYSTLHIIDSNLLCKIIYSFQISRFWFSFICESNNELKLRIQYNIKCMSSLSLLLPNIVVHPATFGLPEGLPSTSQQEKPRKRPLLIRMFSAISIGLSKPFKRFSKQA